MSDTTKTGINLNFETAENITLLSLLDQYRYLSKELKEHREEGKYLHPEDAYNSEFKLLPALRIIIEYYGGDVNER